jgi:uncharacterized protein (TIGR02246 family)
VKRGWLSNALPGRLISFARTDIRFQLAFVFAAAMSLSCDATERSLNTAARDSVHIEELYAEWFGAMSAGSVDRLTELMNEDVIVRGPAGPTFVGRDRLGEGLTAFHAQFTENVEYDLKEMSIQAEWAFVQLSERAWIVPRSGGLAQGVVGTHLAVLARGADNRWRVRIDLSKAGDSP